MKSQQFIYTLPLLRPCVKATLLLVTPAPPAAPTRKLTGHPGCHGEEFWSRRRARSWREVIAGSPWLTGPGPRNGRMCQIHDAWVLFWASRQLWHWGRDGRCECSGVGWRESPDEGWGPFSPRLFCLPRVLGRSPRNLPKVLLTPLPGPGHGGRWAQPHS